MLFHYCITDSSGVTDTTATSITLNSASNTSNDEEPERETAPKMSIHKLVFNENYAQSSLAYIEHIIGKYNENEKNKFKYNVYITDKISELNEENRNETFQMKVYTQMSGFVSKFTKSYGQREDATEQILNGIIFYYNETRIFAMTKRHSWRLIQPYVDYEFPER